jgi:iron-sulfur cluster repair protein YtfE (RIC family)
MFRFTDLIDAHQAVEDVVARYPVTREVFEANGVRRCCWSCAIRTAALRGGLDLSLLLEQLNRTALQHRLEVQ